MDNETAEARRRELEAAAPVVDENEPSGEVMLAAGAGRQDPETGIVDDDPNPPTNPTKRTA